MQVFDIQFDRELGGGGEGQVYLAVRRSDGRAVAIKFSNQLNSALARRHIQIELNRVRRAQGLGTIQVLDWNLHARRPFLVFELGQSTLEDTLQANRRARLVYRPAAAVKVASRIAFALHEIHTKDVIHRDVKPGNIVYVDGQLKLIDFGLGRTRNRPTSLQTRAFRGTEEYAAPEQLLQGRVDERADLYAVGMVLYEMLMGHRPSRLPSAYVDPSSRLPNVLPALDDLLRDLLQWSPSRRPPTAVNLWARLEAIERQYVVARRVWAHFVGGTSNPY